MDVSRPHQNKDDKIPKRMYIVLNTKKEKVSIMSLNGCIPSTTKRDDKVPSVEKYRPRRDEQQIP